MAQITTAKTFNVENISFSDVQKNRMGGNMVYLQYNGGKLVFQTPMMHAPFGLSTYTDANTGKSNYSISLSFRGENEDAKIAGMRKSMDTLDTFLIDAGVKNSKAWFGKQQKRDVIEALYRPLVKEASKEPEKYAPTIKMKIPDRDGEFTVGSFDYKTKQPFDINMLAKGAKIQMILECSSVWFVGKTQFGVTWRVAQMRVQQPENLMNVGFLDDSDDEHDDDDSADEDYNENDSQEDEHADL